MKEYEIIRILIGIFGYTIVCKNSKHTISRAKLANLAQYTVARNVELLITSINLSHTTTEYSKLTKDARGKFVFIHLDKCSESVAKAVHMEVDVQVGLEYRRNNKA